MFSLLKLRFWATIRFGGGSCLDLVGYAFLPVRRVVIRWELIFLLCLVCGDEEWSSAIDDSSGSFFQEFVIRTGRFGGRVMRFVAPES